MRILPALLIIFIAMPALAAEPSPLTMLDNPEKTYYEKVFGYTMDTIKPGEKYDWESYAAKGSIQVDALFVSKSGANCRNFSETFTVKGQAGSAKGTGCKRDGAEGWCKLKADDAKTCAMEKPASMFDGFSLGTNGMTVPSSPNITLPAVNADGASGSMPNTPNVHGPDVPAPQGNPSGKGIVDSVTSGAGKAAGQATGGFIKWFGSTFR